MKTVTMDSQGIPADGEHFFTSALQLAIDECCLAGGGRVVLPPGRYLTGTIALKSGVSLVIESGATLLGSTDLADFNDTIRALIIADGAENISIEGGGTIDGQGHTFYEGRVTDVAGYYEEGFRPDRMICLCGCKNVRMKDVTLTNSFKFNVQFVECDLVHVDGVSIFAPWYSPNTDGIDPTSSRNVFISGCYIECGDDAICIKSKGSITENIVVSNCILKTRCAAIKFGTGGLGATRNCMFSNLVIHGSTFGISFYMKDDGYYEDIHFSNLLIDLPEDKDYWRPAGFYPIMMDIEARQNATALGHIRNVSFSGVHIKSRRGLIMIAGYPGRDIENLSFSDITYQVLERDDTSLRVKPRGNRFITYQAENDMSQIPAYFAFGYVSGLRMRNINICDVAARLPLDRYAFFLRNVTNATLYDIAISQNMPNQKLSLVCAQNCDRLIIRDVQSELGCAFAELTGCSRVSFDSNMLGNSTIYTSDTPSVNLC